MKGFYKSTDVKHGGYLLATDSQIQLSDETTKNGSYPGAYPNQAESEEELKSLLMKAKEESEKVGLKCNIKKTEIMASGPITSWQIDGETVADFIFWAPTLCQMMTAAMKLKDACFLEEKL